MSRSSTRSPINDSASAMMAAFGVVVALHARELTGEGQDMQTSWRTRACSASRANSTSYEGAPAGPARWPRFHRPVRAAALLRVRRRLDRRWPALGTEQFGQLAAALGHPRVDGPHDGRAGAPRTRGRHTRRAHRRGARCPLARGGARPAARAWCRRCSRAAHGGVVRRPVAAREQLLRRIRTSAVRHDHAVRTASPSSPAHRADSNAARP